MKKTITNCFLVFSLFFIHQALYAQVQINNHDDYFSNKKNGKKTNSQTNVVKIGLLNTFNGEFPVYYERGLKNWLSVQGGAGLTFYNVGMFFNDEISGAIVPQAGNVMFSSGYTLKLSARFYPSGDAPEGFYLSPELRYKEYNINFNSVQVGYDSITGGTVSGNISDKVSDFDIVGTVGYQFISDNNFVCDMYAGFGGSARNYDLFTEDGNNSFYYTRKSDFVAFISIGLTLGVAF